MTPTVRRYRPEDEASWLRCRVLGFLDSQYFDDVKTRRTTFDGEAIQLVATVPAPASRDGACSRVGQAQGTEQVVGILDVELWQQQGLPVATIDTIAVHPDHRRSGLADAMLARALADLSRAGVTTLDAWTREDGAATAWYVRHGFVITDEYLHVYPGHDEAEGFGSPESLSRPLQAFCHARLEDEAVLRTRYARVHRCRRFARPVHIPLWTHDPAIVATYDAENTARADEDFYLALARQLQVDRVTDVGCGTGTLATRLAAAGHTVTGVDPAEAMLAVARARPGGHQVHWIVGSAAQAADDDAHLVLMSGHVAQYFLSDRAWHQVLGHIRRTLRPGGYLAFESRNPAAGAWRRWTREHTEATFPHPDGGQFTSWVESVAVFDSPRYGAIETHRGHVLLPDGTHQTTQETLRFRPWQDLRRSLEATGFIVERTWGDFHGGDLTANSPEFIVLARRA